MPSAPSEPKHEPAAGVGVHYTRRLLELARGRDADALAAMLAAERLAGVLAAPHLLVMRVRALLLQALVRLGETDRAEHGPDALAAHLRQARRAPPHRGGYPGLRPGLARPVPRTR